MDLCLQPLKCKPSSWFVDGRDCRPYSTLPLVSKSENFKGLNAVMASSSSLERALSINYAIRVDLTSHKRPSQPSPRPLLFPPVTFFSSAFTLFETLGLWRCKFTRLRPYGP
jgi:hypothetical protein